MSLIAKAEVITVDDVELTIMGKRLSWLPAEYDWPSVRYKIERSLTILDERSTRLLGAIVMGDAAAGKAMKK